jgi:hypothetical protein
MQAERTTIAEAAQVLNTAALIMGCFFMRSPASRFILRWFLSHRFNYKADNATVVPVAG